MSQHIADLFGGKQQYWTPLYQRRYVWDTSNWEALWRDLLKIQHQIDAGEDNQHFTGTIVTQPYGNSQEKYEIIDGQQRLTTFQIIFCVIRDLCASGVYPHSITSEIESDVVGFAKLSTLQMEDKLPPYRLLITKERDKEAFQSVVSREVGERIKKVVSKVLKEPQSLDVSELSDQDRIIGSALKEFQLLASDKQLDQNRIITAYGYFGTKIMNYLVEEGTAKLLSLTQTLSYRFHVNHAHLGSNDGPQQVFESINDTGKALDEFDLLRNDLFLRVGDRQKQTDWYEKFWRDFDEAPFWEGTGRVDEFLRYFLTAKLGPILFDGKRLFHDIYKKRYHEKLRRTLGCDENTLKFVEIEFDELAKYAKTYRKMEDSTTDIGRWRQFYKDLNSIFETLDLTSLPPFILYVENQVENPNERDQVYKILESYMIRCQLRGGVNVDRTAHNKIDTLFIAIIKEEINIKDPMISKTVAEYLASDRPGRNWLNNEAVLSGLRRVGYQIRFGSSSAITPIRAMLRYIFYRIECEMRIIDAATREDGSTVKLNFNDFFSWLALVKPLSKDQKLSTSYSIGNLIFCKDPLPRYLSFSEKKEILSHEPNGTFLLNKRMDKYQTWGLPQIDDREKELLTHFYNIWPAAEDFAGDAAKPKVKSSVARQPPKLKVEPQWISMIQSGNSKSITFVTYSQVEELLEIKISGDKIIGVNPSGYEQMLEESHLLFACSTEAWLEVEPYIEPLSYVRSEQLHPPHNQNQRLEVANTILTLAQQEQNLVSLVTRYGHLLEGTLESFDKDAIYMQIREHRVVVYRRNIYELATGEWGQGVVTEFDKTRGFGYIKSSEYPHIFVHVTEVRSRNSNVLQTGQKVEFDLNRTTKGLSAIDVVLIEE